MKALRALSLYASKQRPIRKHEAAHSETLYRTFLLPLVSLVGSRGGVQCARDAGPSDPEREREIINTGPVTVSCCVPFPRPSPGRP